MRFVFLSQHQSAIANMLSRSIPKWKSELSDGVPQSVQVIKPSARNDHIILGSRQSVRTVSINDTNSGLNTLRSMKATTACTAIAFHPIAESVIASAGSNGEVSILYYGAQNIAPLYDKWIAHSRAIHAMDFLPINDSDPRNDEVFLVTVSADGDINLWNLCIYFGKKESWRKPFLVCNVRADGLRCGVRDLDCRRLKNSVYEIIVGCDDGSVECYESRMDNFPDFFSKFRIAISTQTINSVKFSPTAPDCFATGGKDSYIRVFENETCVSAIRTSLPVWAIRWRPMGKQFIAACHSVMDNGIYVWDLDSHLMPAYVFNSHGENVTDFFWADTNHIMSCSRDNTIQLHQIKQAIIPIERMRTVNISFSPLGSLTRVCDVINRDKFEKNHGELKIEIAKKKGFPAEIFSSKKSSSVSRSSSLEDLGENRLVIISNVQGGLAPTPEDLIAAAPALIEFISAISREATTMDSVGKCCEKFASKIDCIGGGKLTPTHAEAIRFLAWLILDRPDMVPQAIQEYLAVFRRNNDLLMVLAVSVICMYSPIPNLGTLISGENFFKFSSSLIELFKKHDQWKLAAEYVYMSPVSEVRALSHVRTGINLTCTKCKRECDVGTGPDVTCTKCKDRLNVCVLCGDSVRGLWQTCPGCTHGGHPRHLDWWFSKYNTCPVPGCLHQCYC